MSVYLDLVWMPLPDTGPDPDRSVNASPRLPRQQEIEPYGDEGRAIWMPERKVTVSSGNRRGELTNHIWYFKPGWGQSDETLMDVKCPLEDCGDLTHGPMAILLGIGTKQVRSGSNVGQTRGHVSDNAPSSKAKSESG